MTNEIFNFGVGGAVVVFVIKEMFQFLKGTNDKGLVAISKTLDNSIMMLELLQERAKDHEGNAKQRHIELTQTIGEHGKDCRTQAERMREILSSRE